MQVMRFGGQASGASGAGESLGWTEASAVSAVCGLVGSLYSPGLLRSARGELPRCTRRFVLGLGAQAGFVPVIRAFRRRSRSRARRRLLPRRRRDRSCVSETSAMPVGLRSRVPAKITSSMRAPRRVLADCSPSTQVMASEIFDLPQPFGPMMPATPSPWNFSSVRSQNDLKPRICSFFSFSNVTPYGRCIRRRTRDAQTEPRCILPNPQLPDKNPVVQLRMGECSPLPLDAFDQACLQARQSLHRCSDGRHLGWESCGCVTPKSR